MPCKHWYQTFLKKKHDCLIWRVPFTNKYKLVFTHQRLSPCHIAMMPNIQDTPVKLPGSSCVTQEGPYLTALKFSENEISKNHIPVDMFLITYSDILSCAERQVKHQVFPRIATSVLVVFEQKQTEYQASCRYTWSCLFSTLNTIMRGPIKIKASINHFDNSKKSLPNAESNVRILLYHGHVLWITTK